MSATGRFRPNMDLSVTLSKRKSSDLDEDEITTSACSSKISKTAGTGTGTAIDSNIEDLTVLITGTERRMTSYNPLLINRQLIKLLGSSYQGIRTLPSGDLALRCSNVKQMQAILECDNLGDSAKNIPISVTKYSGKPYKSRAVTSGVPIDVSEYDIVESLSDIGVNFAKRLKRRTDKGLEYSLSMPLGFKSNQAAESVKLGYLIFRTKPYNPPPLRCFNCNVYGHIGKHCRGKKRCSKCGSTDHEWENCNKEKKCVNCHGTHSAAFAGCRVYRQEARIQVLGAKENISYMERK